MKTLWGIDLGGTKIEGVVLRGDEVLARRRIPTEAEQGYRHIVCRIESVVKLLEEVTGLERPERIGIGTPGSTDPASGLHKNSNTVCLNGQPLQSDISSTLGVATVLANDANCFALAEATMGVARGYGTVFGIIMGTGCGGGVIVNGQMLSGAHGVAGEWGHNVLHQGGAACYCGKRGCVECYLSGPGVSRGHHERTGESLSLKEIAGSQSPACQETIDRLCQDFGHAVSIVANVIDPDAIILGGGGGKVDALMTRGREELAKHFFNPTFHTPLLKPQFGDSAGVFGAAMLVSGLPG